MAAGWNESNKLRKSREARAMDFTSRQITAALEEPSKADLQRQLAEAAANTARQQQGDHHGKADH
jgi:hypothetical protein